MNDLDLGILGERGADDDVIEDLRVPLIDVGPPIPSWEPLHKVDHGIGLQDLDRAAELEVVEITEDDDPLQGMQRETEIYKRPNEFGLQLPLGLG